MATHSENRDSVILAALREELVGPSLRGTEIDLSGNVHFDTPAAAAGPWLEKGSRQEVLTRDKPTKRYGVAVLYPFGTLEEDTEAGGQSEAPGTEEDGADSSGSEEGEPAAPNLSADAAEDIQAIASRTQGSEGAGESDDLQIAITNTYRPSSLGLTFLARIPEGNELRVSATGGR